MAGKAEEARQKLAQWYGNCDPGAPLALDVEGAGGAAWYVPFDAWEEGGTTHALRGPATAEALVTDIRLNALQPRAASAQLFAGFRGTGKSTELSRVASLLRDDGDFSVLRMRADDYHHMSDALSVEELALVLAAGIGERAMEALGVELLERKSIWERIADFLNREIEVSDFRWSLFGGLELRGLLHKGMDFRDRLQALLAERPDQLRDFLHGLVTELADDIYPRQLVLLVDGLDKYYAPAERVGKVYRQMADLFFHHDRVLRLPACHVIYTIPPYLAFLNQGIDERYGGRLHVLPSVKIHDHPQLGRARNDLGFAALEQVLAHRVDLDALFGRERAECVTMLVEASGGHVRDLCHLAREAIRTAFNEGLPIGAAEAGEAVRAVAQTHVSLFQETTELLGAVASLGSLAGLSQESLGDLARAMDQQLVLCYRNGSFWYDVHPLVRRQLAAAAAPEPG